MAKSVEEMIDDILVQLRIPDAEVVHTRFFRPNLELDVVEAKGDFEKRGEIVELLNAVEGTGIIYAATVKAVNEIAEFLRVQGLAVEAYPPIPGAEIGALNFVQQAHRIANLHSQLDHYLRFGLEAGVVFVT